MQVIFESTNAQRKFITDLESKLPIHEKFSLRLYRGLNSCISEAIKGIGKLFLAKEKVLLLGNSCPQVNAIGPELSRAGNKLVNIDVHTKDFKEQIIKNLDGDLSCAVLCLDNPITGEIYLQPEDIDEILKKRVFCVFISFQWHRCFEIEHNPFAIFCCHINHSIALSFLGSRSRKIENNTFGSYSWHQEDVKILESAFEPISQDKNSIQTWENSLQPEFKPFLNHDGRIFDRALIYNKCIDSENFRGKMLNEFSLPEDSIVPLSLCFWQGVHSLDFLHNSEIDSEVVRGTLVIDKNFIEKIDTSKLKNLLLGKV